MREQCTDGCNYVMPLKHYLSLAPPPYMSAFGCSSRHSALLCSMPRTSWSY